MQIRKSLCLSASAKRTTDSEPGLVMLAGAPRCVSAASALVCERSVAPLRGLF